MLSDVNTAEDGQGRCYLWNDCQCNLLAQRQGGSPPRHLVCYSALCAVKQRSGQGEASLIFLAWHAGQGERRDWEINAKMVELGEI